MLRSDGNGAPRQSNCFAPSGALRKPPPQPPPLAYRNALTAFLGRLAPLAQGEPRPCRYTGTQGDRPLAGTGWVGNAYSFSMIRSQTHGHTAGTPLRLWPGIAAAALLLVLRFGVKVVVPDFAGFAVGMMSSFAALFAIVVWWLFFSRARWIDRAGGLAMLAAAVGVTLLIGHESIGLFWLFAYGIPSFAAAFVAGIVAGRRLADGPRRVGLAAALLLVSGIWVVLRTEGVSGDHFLVFSWRWTASPEERLLASSTPAPPAATVSDVEPASVELVTTGRNTASLEPDGAPAPAPAGDPAVSRQVEWPGFRGAGRDGIVRGGAPIATDWSTSPVVEMWRRPVGPGWSSFAVSGGLIYTLEQRGDDEVVAAYRLASGDPVWLHRTAARFFEPMAGAGPRSTPEVRDGRVFTFGATGIVNALDAATGRRLWSRDARADADVPTPAWGFSSSPLVVGDLLSWPCRAGSWPTTFRAERFGGWARREARDTAPRICSVSTARRRSS